MIKNVLIVDDDQSLLLSLKEGLEKYNDTFSVLLAGDGLIATELIKKTPVSLVIADLKMPNMDGFSLLAFIIEDYPEVPVIIMTAYSTPQIEKLAKEGGAISYIEKPFGIENLARKILAALRMESEGGTLHGISSGMFLQLIEIEEKTCTIRVNEKSMGKKGVLFFSEGVLLDARSNGLQGEAASHDIFSWDKVDISIQNSCSIKEKRIKANLQSILLESSRLRDEASAKIEYEKKEIKSNRLEEKGNLTREELVREKLETELGEKGGIEDIYRDNQWNTLIARFRMVGDLLGTGRLKTCLIDKGEREAFILLPDENETTVISVTQRSPRDRILNMLAEWE